MEPSLKHARRIISTLFLTQSLASAGFISAFTLSSILGSDLSGKAGWAGVPVTVYLLGSAGSALLWGHLMDILGRRGGLTAGLILGTAGAGAAFIAIDRGSFLGYMLAMLLIGVANSAMTLSRFAASEVVPPEGRGRAISRVVLGGTVGAIFGPLLVGPAGQAAMNLGANELAGAYGATFILLAFAAALVFARLRPDPRDLGRQVDLQYPDIAHADAEPRSVWVIVRQPAAALAVSVMVLGQMVMVMVMVIISLYMRQQQHPLPSVSLVISAHTFGMYAFSIFSGQMTDRYGRGRVILLGSLMLALACLAAAFSSQLIPLMLALFLLGLGWNLCFVGGSALLADQLRPAERSRTQGSNDLLVGLASAAGSLGSGVVFSLVGYAAMTIFSALVALLMFGLTMIWLRSLQPSKAGVSLP